MIRRICIVLLSLFLNHANAVEREEKFFSLALGAKFSNAFIFRGECLYDGFQASPVIYVGLWNHRIQFLGTSLEFVDFVSSDWLRLRTKLNTVSDRPFLRTNGPLTARNARESSFEWTSRLEFFYPSFSETWVQADLAYSKDLKAHAGHYLEGTLRATIARIDTENGLPRFQPQVFLTLGWGDGRHNQYLYGSASRESGFNHLAYGVLLTMPSRIDSHYPVLRFFRYDLIGDLNRSGSLVAQTGGFHLEATWAIGIF